MFCGYNINVASSQVLYRTVDATGTSSITVQFDWKCNGEEFLGVLYDYGELVYSTNIVTPAWTAFGGQYQGQTTTPTTTVALPAALDNTTFLLGWRWTNDNAFGTAVSFGIDNIVVQGLQDAPVEDQLAATDERYLGPFGTAVFYDGSELMAVIQNNSAHDFGCTTVSVDRAGTTPVDFWDGVNNTYDLAAKTFEVVPTNNNFAASYTITLFYTAAEVTAWEAGTGNTWAGNARLVKSPGPISNVNPGTPFPDGPVTVIGGTQGAYNADYFIEGTFNNGFSGFGVGDPGPPPPALPVELLRFGARALDTAVQLDWQTASEVNFSHFIMERSSDGSAFRPFGQQQAGGAPDRAHTYHALDPAPAWGTNYYRLKQVDLDGSYQYSSVAQVLFTPDNRFVVGPSPFEDQLQVRFRGTAETDAVLILYTPDGRQVLQHAWKASPQRPATWPVPPLGAGIYLYEIRTGDQSYKGRLVHY
ncbi:MAG: hypothetical protein OHK0039_28190 [Bacteroidia bacterium]